MAQQPEQRAGLGREQALQPHQHPAQLAQLGPFGPELAVLQVVLECIDLQRGFANNVYQHIALVVQQVVEQRHRRVEAAALVDGLAQPIDRSQRVGSRADGQALGDGQPQRRDLRRLERELVGHVIDHRDQLVGGVLDAGRARTLFQGLKELGHQLQLGPHPLLGGSVGQVEVQPDEFPAALNRRSRQPRQRLVERHRSSRRIGQEQVAADQTISV